MHPILQRLSTYWPLILIVLTALIFASAKQGAYPAELGHGLWMHDFMGSFLLLFAMFKLFDLPGFADGFAKYDLLAQRSRPYALAYPFIELGLGIAYLAVFLPALTYLLTLAVFGFGAYGVFTALRSGINVNCACLGTRLKVPLSTVAVVENVGMAVMALFMLVGRVF